MAEVSVSGQKAASSITGTKNTNRPGNAAPVNNNNNGKDLFSPTSAAAWALSTLHNFGAAAPTDNGERPATDSLTGTRLFNNVTGNMKNINPATQGGTLTGSAADSNRKIPAITTVSASVSATKGAATPAVSWGQTNVQYPITSQIVDPSASAPRQKSLARKNATTSMVTPTPKKLKVNADGSSSSYSRKKKSLGVLAENFIKCYESKPRGSVIVVDNAAIDLGVERRRIYDVVNILESISLVEKKHKNTYSWMGMGHLDGMFCDLQAKAILDYPQDAIKHLCIVDENGNPLLPNQLCAHHSHCRKENKSLAKLSQEFLQVFLVGFETLSLPEASDKIQGTTSMEELVALGGGSRSKQETQVAPVEAEAKEMKAAAARGLKTKIRRLYDIANVFLSVGLLKKVENADASRRPNFSWGYKLSALDIYKLHEKNKKAMQMQMQMQMQPLSSAFVTSTYTENTGLVKARHDN